MRFRAGQRVPVWLQMIVVVVCATAMVIAADAEDYCGETSAKCIVAIGKGCPARSRPSTSTITRPAQTKNPARCDQSDE